MSEERRYYIENAITEDKWLTYAEAHRYGCTRIKPQTVTVYDSEVHQVSLRKDIETSQLFDLRPEAELPHDWVNDISDFDPPLYKKTGNITLYMGEIPSTYVGYTTSISSNSPTVVENAYHDGYTSISEGHNSLYYLYGITDHKCDNYYIQEGVVLCWYDSVTHLYWDNQPGRRVWSGSPPSFTVEMQDVSITPNPGRFEFWPQWEEDLSQMPMRYRSYSFDAQDDVLDAQPPMLVGYQFVDPFEDYQNLSNYLFYPDKNEFNVTLYVYPEEGAVEPATGILRPQGYSYTGDMQTVWVDSDADVTFWRGSTTYIFGQSWDETHSEATNNEIYWCSSVYMTYNELHDAGYTKTEATDVEVWDPSLIYYYRPQELLVSFITDSSGSSYTISPGNTYHAVFTNKLLQYEQCKAVGLRPRGMFSDYHTFEYPTSNGYLFEILEVYSDPYGLNPVSVNFEDFSFSEDISNHVLKISTSATYTNVCTYRLRIYPPIELYLHFKESGNTPIAVTFDVDQKYWAELQSDADRQLLINNGFSVVDDGTLHGEVGWNQDYSYTPLAIYSDINSENLVTDDMPNFVVEQYGTVACIKAIAAFTTEVMTWKLLMQRINKQYIDVLLACKYDPCSEDSFRLVNFSSANSNWWAEVTSERDKNLLQNLDYFLPDTSWGLFGEAKYDPACSYKIVGFYSDMGKTIVSVDESNFYFAAGGANCISIYSKIALPSVYVKTYRLRIYLPTV